MSNKLQIRYAPLAFLIPDPANARLHSRRQIQKIATSIKRFGFNNPIAIDGEHRILCGHARYAGAHLLGLEQVPVICIDHLSPAAKRAYMLADNRLADESKFDPKLLAAEIQKLILLEPEFEITDTAFEMAEIDALLTPPDHDAAEPVAPINVPQVSRPGDLWQFGDHLLFCGDALDSASYPALMAGERAEMAITDPPYNRPVKAIGNKGRTTYSEFVEASGEMTSPVFQAFLTAALACMVAASVSGSIPYICMDWRGLRELLAAGDAVYTEQKNLIVWDKGSGGMGSFYRSQHELMAVYKSGSGKHQNNIQLGAFGRNRTNVWQYAGNNSFHRGRNTEVALHPTVKPVALYADAMLDCSRRGAIILDVFAGSGVALLAAERTGRRARLIEKDPHYVDVIIHRARTLLGLSAVNLWTGEVLSPLEEAQPATRRRKAGK
jgi:hypothetical protein